MNRSKAFSASAWVSACQMSCSACFAFGWTDFGRQFSTDLVEGVAYNIGDGKLPGHGGTFLDCGVN
jgi:hypothetical protein